MNPIKVKKDKYGVKLKYPDKTCKNCRRYTCFQGMEKCVSDFAQYGCSYFLEPLAKW